MLLDLERLVVGFQHHRDVDVERRVGVAQPFVVGVLHVAARILPVFFGVDVRLHEFRVEVLHEEELALLVNHRLVLAGAVNHEERRDACGFRHAVVVGAERRGDVHDARTVRSGHVVADDHAECVAHRLHPREQLLVADAFQFGAFPHLVHDFVGALHLFGEVGTQQLLGQDDRLRPVGIGIAAFDLHVFDCGTHGQRGVRRQGPWRCGPGEEVEVAFDTFEELLAPGVADHPELRRAGRVLHVAVAARLVQLVGREARSGGRRVGLDGVALVEQALVEELLQQPPQRLDVFVVVGDVRIVHVDPVAHLAREVLPDARELHHRLAARAVVLLDGDLLADVFLGDAELLLDAQFHGQSVSVPSGLAVHEVALLRLVAAEYVLDRAGHDVVDAGHAVCRGGTLVEYERGMALAGRDAFVERVACVPFAEHVGGYACQVEAFILLELHIGRNFFANFLTIGKDIKKI